MRIFWGANIGTPQEALASGRLADVKERSRPLAREVREAAGFVMDAYLLRRRQG